MTGHGEKVTRQQDRAIAALLSESTIAAAAKAAGVSESSLTRWMQSPSFSAAYRDARRQLVESAIGGLQRASAEAVEALRRNLTSGRATAEIRAAEIVLTQAVKGVELLDLEARIAALEAAGRGE